MSTSLLTVYVILLVIALYKGFRETTVLDFIPSLFWLVLMVVPFFVQKNDFISTYVPAQSLGIFTFAFAILISDAWHIKGPKKTFKFERRQLLIFAVLLTVVSLFLQISHLALMPKIPLWEKYAHGITDDAVLSQMREDAAKLLRAPPGFLYLTQISMMVFTPVAFAILLYLRRYALAVTALVVSLIYSRAALVKGPVYILLALSLIIVWFSLEKLWQNRILKAAVAVGVCALLGATPFLATNEFSIFRYKAKTTQELEQNARKAFPNLPVTSMAMADDFRSLRLDPAYDQVPGWQKNLNFFIYRVFLVPSEVSHRWYHYYPELNQGFLGFYGLTPASRGAGFQHPSNRVGLWAYQSRYPTQYGDTVHAYCSIDADAFSRWGVKGIFLIAFLTAVIRLMIKVLTPQTSWGQAISFAALVLFASSLPVASLFAMLVAQGVIAYLAVLLCLRLWPVMVGLRLRPVPVTPSRQAK